MKFELEHEGDSEIYEDLQRYLKYHPRLTRFLFNPAGLVFLMGSLLFAGMSLGWLAIFLLDPPVAGHMAATVATEVFPGKEFSTAVGLGLGLHPVIVFGIVFVQNLITTSWVYPLFYTFRRHQVGKDNFFGYFFTKVEREAKQHEGFIRTWGAWGIFLFMLIPFAVNGPLIGAILGKLAGIRTRYILPALVGATAVSTAAWVALWHYASEPVSAVVAGPYGHWIQAGFVLGFTAFVAWTLAAFLRDRRRYRDARRRRDEAAAPSATYPVEAEPGRSSKAAEAERP